MIIDGDRVPMEPGDLILTPGWSWHGHVHPGGGEPAVWMDGLDVPFVLGLRAGFIRDDPHPGDPLPVRDTTGTAAETAGTAALLPVGTRHGRHSPVRRYPWDQAYPALRRLMARSPGRGTLTSLEYRSPLTGGPALATLGCLLQGLPGGARTRPRRETASSVIVVARGTGTLTCGGQTFALSPDDVAAIPAWTRHQLAASDRGLSPAPAHRPPHPPRLRPVPGRGRGVTAMADRISVNGTELEYQLRGTGAGEPVVLIHWGVAATWAEPLLDQPALASRYQLLSYHRAGFARSGRLHGPLTMAAHAAHCQQLMRELGITRAHIVGHSSSVPVALQLALDAPEAVHTLTLMEAARPAPPTGTERHFGTHVAMPAVTRHRERARTGR